MTTSTTPSLELDDNLPYADSAQFVCAGPDLTYRDHRFTPTIRLKPRCDKASGSPRRPYVYIQFDEFDLGDVLTHNKAVELEHHYRRFFFRQDVEMMPTRIDELLAVAIDRFLAASTVGS